MSFDAREFLESLYAEPLVVAERPEDLPDDWRTEWLERAAIREFDGGQVREHAEAEAFDEIFARMRAANGFRESDDFG